MLIALRRSAGALCFGLVAAIVAALLAHLAIDAAGDVALQHDTYDAIAHRSRDLAALTVIAAMVAFAARFVFSALDGAASRRRIAQMLAVPSSPAFVTAVAGAALVLLIGMESWDTFAATGAPGGLADALGGSIALGLGVLLPLAIVFGTLAWHALRALASCSDALLRAISAWFAAIATAARPASRHLSLAPVCVRERHALLRDAAKRGPPALLSV